MPERLLPKETVVRKIELSLKLQGKSFTIGYLSCNHCKFHWASIKVAGQPIPPEKYKWYCSKYQNKPTQSFIHFKPIRINEKGEEIPIQLRWNEVKKIQTSEPIEGEKDTVKVVNYSTYVYIRTRRGRRIRKIKNAVCRRFEACPR